MRICGTHILHEIRIFLGGRRYGRRTKVQAKTRSKERMPHTVFISPRHVAFSAERCLGVSRDKLELHLDPDFTAGKSLLTASLFRPGVVPARSRIEGSATILRSD